MAQNENRTLENADFDSDIVDAGDVGAGHSVTALYQIAPRGLSEETDPVDLAQAALDRFVRFSENVDNNVRFAREGTILNIDGSVISEESKEETENQFRDLLARPEFEEVEVRNNRFRSIGKKYAGDFTPQQVWLYSYDAEKAVLGTDDEWRELPPW